MLLVPACRVLVSLALAGAEVSSALAVAPPVPARPAGGGMPPVLPPAPVAIPTRAAEAVPAATAEPCRGVSPAEAGESAERLREEAVAASDDAAASAAARGYFECVAVWLRAEVDLGELARGARAAMDLELSSALAADRQVAAARQEAASVGARRLRQDALGQVSWARAAARRRDPGAAIDAEVAASVGFAAAASLVDDAALAGDLRGDAADALHRAFVLAAEHHALWAVCPAIEVAELESPRLELDRLLCDPPRMSSRERAALRARVDALAGFNERDRQAWSRRLRLYDPQDLVGIGAAGLSLAALSGSLTLRSRYHGNCFQIGGPPRCADDPAIAARSAWAGSVVLAVAAGALAVASAALLAERRIRRRARRCAAGAGGGLVCAF